LLKGLLKKEMFKRREILLVTRVHGKLSATLAQLWLSLSFKS